MKVGAYLFEVNGYLSPGEMDISVDEFFSLFVINSQFNKSKKRTKQFAEFMTFVKILNNLGLIDGLTKIIIDGSFCSSKNNPNDIDIFIYYDVASTVSSKLEYQIDLTKTTLKRKGLHIVSFRDFSNQNPDMIDQVKLRLDQLSRKEFERYFSHTKDNVSKGYVVINRENLRLGGEQNVIATNA